MTLFIYLLMSQEEDHWKCGIKGKNKTDLRRSIRRNQIFTLACSGRVAINLKTAVNEGDQWISEAEIGDVSLISKVDTFQILMLVSQVDLSPVVMMTLTWFCFSLLVCHIIAGTTMEDLLQWLFCLFVFLTSQLLL